MLLLENPRKGHIFSKFYCPKLSQKLYLCIVTAESLYE